MDALKRLVGDPENPRPLRSVDDLVLLAVIGYTQTHAVVPSFIVGIYRAAGIDMERDDFGLGGKRAA
jgi:hypothetical protein